MKKIYSTLLLTLSTLFLFAQQGHMYFKGHSVQFNGHEIHLKRTSTSSNVQNQHSPQTYQSILVDYDGQEAKRLDTNYNRFIFDMNDHYIHAKQGQRYCVVAFDSLFDTNLGKGYNAASVTSVRIDSVFALMGHENNSGKNDTIIISVIPVNAAGYPQDSVAALWRDSVITKTGLSTGNNYLTAFQYSKAVNLMLDSASGTKKFAVMLQFKGDTAKDTLGFIAGSEKTVGKCGNSSTSVQHPSQFFTTKSAKHYANSYALWAPYSSNGLLPTENGSDIYYDCNGDNKATYPPDGYSYFQNIAIWVKLTINDFTGINENTSFAGLTLQQNNPNPVSDGITSINYSIAQPAHISLSIYDLTGKKLMDRDQGLQSTGAHTINMDVSSLSNGMYFYTLSAGQSRQTKRFVIVR